MNDVENEIIDANMPDKLKNVCLLQQKLLGLYHSSKKHFFCYVGIQEPSIRKVGIKRALKFEKVGQK